jgi:hypothetical protein
MDYYGCMVNSHFRIFTIPFHSSSSFMLDATRGRIANELNDSKLYEIAVTIGASPLLYQARNKQDLVMIIKNHMIASNRMK